MKKDPLHRIDSFREISQFNIDPASIQLLSYKYCTNNAVVVLGKVDPSLGEPISLGMTHPKNKAIAADVEAVLQCPVVPVQLNAYELQHALDVGFGLKVEAEGNYQLSLKAVDQLNFDRDAPVTSILNDILGQAVFLNASDIHIETYEADVDLRFRIDGILHQINCPLSRGNIAAAISRLKIVSGLDITERRTAQDGRITAVYDIANEERLVDFRLSIVPGPFGEDAVLRVLDAEQAIIDLSALGMLDDTLSLLEKIITNPEGMLLVTGPTGSGKTTTLYSILQRINSSQIKVLTVEDPIEYHFEKINQKQVSSKMGFASYARALMRQNPNVILIGEIRDEETAQVGIRAAQTGHLVLSTLHTGGSVRSIPRLQTLGIDDNLIANSLLGCLSQRLVRKICPNCKVKTNPSARESERLGLTPDRTFYEGTGCKRCGQTGYKGRVGIYELFVVDDDIAGMISDGKSTHRIRQRVLEKGMRTLVGDAIYKAEQGMTTLSEILRVVPFRTIKDHLQAP